MPKTSRRGAIAGLSAAAIGVGSTATASSFAARSSSPRSFAYRQVDVFSQQAFRGNPLAIVLGADRLSDPEMALFSKWTNLSETTFLVRPTDPKADYRVRIFSLGEELPFAGHPTLGSCHAWLAAGGRPMGAEIVQQCGVGLVHLRGRAGHLAFEAPQLRRTAPLDGPTLDRLRRGLGLTEGEIVASRLLDGGLEQTVLVIRSRERLLSLKPDWKVLATDGVGLVAPYGKHGQRGDPDFEVRVFDATLANGEDPVTGSFNASVARWMLGEGMAPEHYVVSQGTVLGRAGRVYVDQDQGRTWIGGDIVDRIVGKIDF
jgi:PhzF family phenazine biosynthesis protein